MSEEGAHGAHGMGPRYVRGTVYLGVANWTSYAVNFAIAIMVARILGPEAFGVYAFVVAVNAFIDIVNGLGVAPALVQSKEESEALYDTGYAISFGQALMGLIVTLGVAPVLAAQRSPEAGWFLLLLALARFLLLLSDAVQARLDRQVRFGAISAIHLTARTLPNFACLGLAWAGWGPSSLVLRDLLAAAMLFLLTHSVARYWFRGRVRRGAFRRIMSFSGPMFVARSLDVFLVRLDRLVVGSLLGNTAVGLYHQARFIADAGLVATTPLNTVTFNLYSRLQDHPLPLRRAFSLVNYFLVRGFFGFTALLVVAPAEMLRLLLGEEWVSAAPALRILGLYAGLLPLLQNTHILLFARGFIFTSLRLRLLQAGVFLPGVFFAGWMRSVEGIAASLLAATLVSVAVGWYLNRHLVRGCGRAIYAVPSLALLATIAGFGMLHGLTPEIPSWVMLLLPPLVFWALVALAERAQLFDEISYLRAQFARRDAAQPAEAGSVAEE